MKRRQLLMHPAAAVAKHINTADNMLNSNCQFMVSGAFKLSWGSLSSCRTPEWFRNAKFGIWADWGPQCQPEYGHRCARKMFMEGSGQYKYSPEVINEIGKLRFPELTILSGATGLREVKVC